MPHKTAQARAAYQAKYRVQHASRLRANGAAYRKANRATLLAGKKQHYRANKKAYRDRSKAHWHNLEYWQQKLHHGFSKAKQAGSRIGDIEAITAYYREVFSKASEVCTYCRGEFSISDITIDHKQPFAHGGKHEVSNFVVSCEGCNIKKHTHPYEVWVAKR